MQTSLFTAEAMVIVLPVLGATIATLIISILNWQKNNKIQEKAEKIHVLVNSGKTQLLREILGIRLGVAKLSGKQSDARLAEEALKNLEESERANKLAEKV